MPMDVQRAPVSRDPKPQSASDVSDYQKKPSQASALPTAELRTTATRASVVSLIRQCNIVGRP